MYNLDFFLMQESCMPADDDDEEEDDEFLDEYLADKTGN